MPRQRTLKPGFFRNEELGALSPWHRLCYEGLWCHADRDGRLEYRPKRLKAEIFPYDDGFPVVDDETGAVTRLTFPTLIADLVASRILLRYEVDGLTYLAVPPVAWAKHQRPRDDEPRSVLPGPPSLRSHGTDTGQTLSRSGPVEVPSQSGPRSGIWDLDLGTHTAQARDPRAAHRSHVFCGERLCVPGFLDEEFRRLLGASAAPEVLTAFYARVDANAPASAIRATLGHWRAEFQRAFAVEADRAPPHTCLGNHEPPCASYGQCTQRTLEEGRASRVG